MIRKGFDRDSVEFYWILWIIIIIICIRKRYGKLVLLSLIILFPCIRVPLLFVLLIPLIIFSGHYEFHNASTRYLFSSCITTKIMGHPIPYKPTIFVCNYPTNFTEYLSPHLLNSKICMIVWNKAIVQSRLVKLFFNSDAILFVGKGSQFDKVQSQILSKMRDGYSIIAYIERNYWSRKSKYSVAPLRKGMITIAQKINMTITPVVFDHIDHNLGIITNSNYKVYIDKTRYVLDVDDEMKNISKIFQRKLDFFKIKC